MIDPQHYKNDIITDELNRIKQLYPLIKKPEEFLSEQNRLLYERDLFHFQMKKHIDKNGLPFTTRDFYTRNFTQIPNLIADLPRVLNIGAGAEASRRLVAINTDVSINGKPDVVCDARELPFPDNYFTIVRASHILEHIEQKDILETLKEWKRVLHPDGELHIAVPDAKITFEEIIEGRTKKGGLAISLDETTPPLAQIYGLGYESPRTDSRWKHTIIFSFELLKYFLIKAGFEVVVKREKTDDLAYMCGVDDDSQNRYTLLVTAKNKKKPQPYQTLLTNKSYKEYINKLCNGKFIPDASFVIPTHNEEKNLPYFLSSLEYVKNTMGNKREYIFVLNGCTDKSEELIANFIKNSSLNCILVKSEKGINKSIEAGIENRTYDGFIGKIDVDTLMHPQSIDLLHACLVERPDVQVVYAEPRPLNSMTLYNEVEHIPHLRSRRLYYHGRTCLFRSNPLKVLKSSKLPKLLKAEDVFLSYLFAYYYGLNSISLAPHAIVYARAVSDMNDLRIQYSRLNEEFSALYKIFPPFRLIEQILNREIYTLSYKGLVEAAKEEKVELFGEWKQIIGTK